MPRLATGSLGRLQRGHWNTTVANAWGVLAMERFARRFETAAVTGTTTATLGERALRSHVAGRPRHRAVRRRSSRGRAARADLALAHDGTGTPWATVQSLAAIPLTAPLSTGYRVERSVAPVQQRTAGQVEPRRRRARAA